MNFKKSLIPQDLYCLIKFCFISAIRWRQHTRGHALTSRHTQLLSLQQPSLVAAPTSRCRRFADLRVVCQGDFCSNGRKSFNGPDIL